MAPTSGLVPAEVSVSTGPAAMSTVQGYADAE